LIISVVIFDVFFESIFGHNILGYSSADHTRIVSFFRDETIVGALILCFGYVVATYFLSQNLTLKSKIFFNIFLLMVPLCILISGERSNFIKGSIIFFLILFFLNKTKLLITKKKFIIACIFILLSTLFFNQNVLYKQTEALKRVINVKNSEKFIDRFKSIHYIFHYNIAFEIFKDFPISGVGNKNFRLVACNDRKYINKAFDFNNQKSYIGCSTHPHQIHFELLAEHGLIGYFFFFYIMFIFLKKNLILFNSSNNIFVFTPAIYLLVFLIPLLPSGALFSTFSGTMFWVIFSIANLNLNKKYIG
jgi:O-antigen ligase